MSGPKKEEQIVEVDVAIVGAGCSGLACAAELVRRHHSQHVEREDSSSSSSSSSKKDDSDKPAPSVIVLEASYHSGGRIRTVRESELNRPNKTVAFPRSHDEQTSDNGWLRIHLAKKNADPANSSPMALGKHNFGFEVGAEFVHGPESAMATILEKSNTRLKELFTWAHGDGGPSDEPAPDDGIGYYFMPKKGGAPGEMELLTYEDAMRDPELKHMFESLWRLSEIPEEEARNDKRTLRQYLEDQGVSKRAIDQADSGYANTVCGTLDKIGLSNMVQCEYGWMKDGDGDYRVEGSGTLNESLIVDLEKGIDVRLSTPVTKITTTATGVELFSSRKNLRIRAKVAVITVPVPALQKNTIEFVPPLPREKVDAISSLLCDPALKVHAKFNRALWPSNFHGAICSGSFAPEIWVEGADHGKAPFYLTGFFTSSQALAATKMDTDAVFDAFLKQVSAMFKADLADVMAAYEGGFILDWGKVPHIWGGYTTPSKNEKPDARALYAAPAAAGRLLFAGEAADPHSFMTAHCAVGTGLRAADQARIVLESQLTAKL